MHLLLRPAVGGSSAAVAAALLVFDDAAREPPEACQFRGGGGRGGDVAAQASALHSLVAAANDLRALKAGGGSAQPCSPSLTKPPSAAVAPLGDGLGSVCLGLGGGSSSGGGGGGEGEGGSVWVQRLAGGAATLALRLDCSRAEAEAALSAGADGSRGRLAEAVGALELLCAAARRLHGSGGADGGGWVAPAVADGWGGSDGAGAGSGSAVGCAERRILGDEAPHITIV